METFEEWIRQQLQNRRWSLRKLARESGLSHGLVSGVLSGQLKPSPDFCIRIAQALDIAPETALRIAGILPASTPADSAEDAPLTDPTIQELIDLARNMTPDDRQDLLDYARFRYRQRQQRK